MPSTTRRAAARAGVVVALTVATSATAHVDAAGMSIGELLPSAAGCTALVAGMAALWLVATFSARALHRGWAREVNLLGCFGLGQLLGHLAWSVGSAAPPMVIGRMSGPNTAAPAMSTPGRAGAVLDHAAAAVPGGPGAHEHLAHMAMNHDAMNHAASAHDAMHHMMASDMAGMPGMAAGHSHAMGAAMLLAHLTAAVVSQLLLRAGEHLVAHARDWLARLTPQPPHPVQPTPAFRPALDVVLRRSTWALPRPPPRRGPPQLV